MKRTLAVLVLAALAAGCQNDSALRHAGLGHLAIAAGNLDGALQEFEEAIQLDGALATAYCGLGDAYLKQGKAEKAVSPYRQAILAMPFEFTFQFRLGTVYQVLDRDREAALTYEGAVQLDPDYPPVNINLGVVYYRIGVADADSASRAALLEKGRQYAEKAVELAPEHGFAWSNLGAIYDGLGDPHRAIGAYRKSLQIDPDQAPVHVNLGTAYLSQGRLDKALDEFKLAQGLDPDSVVIRKRIAYVYAKQKKYGPALEQWQEALKTDPEDYEARNNLAAVYMIFYLRRPEQDHIRVQALEEWHQSLENRSDQPEIRAMLAKWSKPGAALAARPGDEAATEAMIESPDDGPWVARDHGLISHLCASTGRWTAPASAHRIAAGPIAEP